MKVSTSTTSSCVEENKNCPYIYGNNYSLYMFIFIVMQAEESLVCGAKIHLN